MLKNIACAINPEVYAARKAEVQIERQTWQLQHPVFFYNTLMFPGEILKLHLFEPRYKVLFVLYALPLGDTRVCLSTLCHVNE